LSTVDTSLVLSVLFSVPMILRTVKQNFNRHYLLTTAKKYFCKWSTTWEEVGFNGLKAGWWKMIEGSGKSTG
jgi:hypothetical protein